jgi:type II secretory pathway pseudopilin PulG
MRARGFTLIELLVIFTVIGIVLAVGLPAFGQFRDDLLGDETRSQLMQDLRMARQLAITRHCLAIVAFGNGVATTDLTGYTIHVDSNSDLQVQAGESRVYRGFPSQTSLGSAALQPVDSLVFDTSGLLLPGTYGGRLVSVTALGRRDTLMVSPTGLAYVR